MSTKNITSVPAGGHSTAAAFADPIMSTTPTDPTMLQRAHTHPAAAVATLQSNVLKYTFPHETYGQGTGPRKVSSGGIAGGSQAAAFAGVFLLSVR